MTQRRTRSDAFFSQERLAKLANAIIGYDLKHYKAVRAKVKEAYLTLDRKTPFDVVWARAITVLRDKYNYTIPVGAPTNHMKDQMRLQRANYERRIANDAEEEAQRTRELNAWKENF